MECHRSVAIHFQATASPDRHVGASFETVARIQDQRLVDFPSLHFGRAEPFYVPVSVPIFIQFVGVDQIGRHFQGDLLFQRFRHQIRTIHHGGRTQDDRLQLIAIIEHPLVYVVPRYRQLRIHQIGTVGERGSAEENQLL